MIGVVGVDVDVVAVVVSVDAAAEVERLATSSSHH